MRRLSRHSWRHGLSLLLMLTGVAAGAATGAARESYVFRFVDRSWACTAKNAHRWLVGAGMLDVDVVSCNYVLRYCRGTWRAPPPPGDDGQSLPSQGSDLAVAEKRLNGLRVLSGGQAHMNQYGQLAGAAAAAAADSSSSTRGVVIEHMSDPLYAQQWGHHSYDVRRAWSVVSACHPSTIVASIDTGADLDHPDLRHLRESYECNSLHPLFHTGCDSGDSVASRHGTGVASVLAGGINDGLGMSGVSNCRLLPIKLSHDGTFGSYEFASAVTYAVTMGATVVTTSIVWSHPTADMVSAVEWAWSRGVPVVAAAGNCNFGSCDIKYPAALSSVLAVGAMDRDDQVPSWQSTVPPLPTPTRRVDLYAPGVDVVVAFNADTSRGDAHKHESGSSFAAPFVAGLLAYGIRPTGPDALSVLAAVVSATSHDSSSSHRNRRFAPCHALRTAHNCSVADCPCSTDDGVDTPVVPSRATTNDSDESWPWWAWAIGLVAACAMIGAIMAQAAPRV